MKILGNADQSTMDWLEMVKDKLPEEMYNHIVMMEDNHFTGDKSAPVGFTAPMSPYAIIPELITPDIACGVSKFKLDIYDLDENNLKKVDEIIKEIYKRSDEQLKVESHLWLGYMQKFGNVNHTGFGTLGGGNHFLEINKDNDGDIYIFVHSGSRNFGGRIYQYYIDKRNQWYDHLYQEAKQAIMDNEDKSTIAPNLKKLKEKFNNGKYDFMPLNQGMSREFNWEMKVVQMFAEANRQYFANTIAKKLGARAIYQYSTIHNYFNDKDYIVRKGAIKANYLNIIPMNIAEGILELLWSDDTKDRNWSLPHGLGRTMSRRKYKKTADLETYLDQTQGIHSMTINEGSIDESPNAYKNSSILVDLKEQAEWFQIYAPIYSFKETEDWLKEQGIGRR